MTSTRSLGPTRCRWGDRVLVMPLVSSRLVECSLLVLWDVLFRCVVHIGFAYATAVNSEILKFHIPVTIDSMAHRLPVSDFFIHVLRIILSQLNYNSDN